MKTYIQIPHVNEQDGIPHRACAKINDATNQITKEIGDIEARLDTIEKEIKEIKQILNS